VVKKKRVRREATQVQEALTVPQAAAIIGKTERATWLDIARGKVPHRRWGRKVIILRSELLEFLKTLPGKSVGEVVEKINDAA
jgi:hypothetical protein